MLKKYIFCITTSFLCFNSAFANENLPLNNSDNKDIIELSAPLFGKIKKSNITKIQEQYNKAFDDDQRIALYLKTPYDKRQYVFPMIHASPFISHKIKTHPEIIIWKNKKPTIIAKQLNNFAKNHLDDLSPFFYVYLDPDFWNPKVKESNLDNSFNNPFAMLPQKEADYVYPTLKQLFNISNQPSENYLKTELSENDILNISNVLTNLDTYQPANGSLQELSLKIINLQKDQIHRAIADPFKVFINSLKVLGEEKSFADFLKKHNISSPNEFAAKADLTLKAFQILNLNLNAAIELNHVQFNRPIKPFEETEFLSQDIEPIDMYIRLHQAKSGDIYFIKQHAELLKSIFKNNFIDKGLMISID